MPEKNARPIFGWKCRAQLYPVCVCMYVCIYICMYVHNMCVCMYVSIHVCMYPIYGWFSAHWSSKEYMHVCMHTHPASFSASNFLAFLIPANVYTCKCMGQICIHRNQKKRKLRTQLAYVRAYMHACRHIHTLASFSATKFLSSPCALPLPFSKSIQ